MSRLNLWYLPPAFFFRRRAMGAASSRPSLRPRLFKGVNDPQSSGKSGREIAEARPIFRRSAKIAIPMVGDENANSANSLGAHLAPLAGRGRIASKMQSR
ncbi:hypothetical protein SSBR45G_27020 [Bradyrhizobium sp. SSBR45G]|nr:hypothetical protein SSBR45G_27020 [Bradyrhizobium sp. SSBR45G]GLH85031.1 hypothetical protein SSBR45R_24910 [Bradyrhizobium sp. SSBR45R]